jgi:hypothetical protein
MYRPANYYAARTAAVNEALKEERAQNAPKPQSVPRIYSAECLRRCGERVQVLLGSFWGDLAGTYVDAVYCYSVGTGGLYIAKMRHPIDRRDYIVLVAGYAQRDDVYDRVISIEAVI